MASSLFNFEIENNGIDGQKKGRNEKEICTVS